MKNILLIMPYGSVGGMERLALTFYNHYKSLGYGVKALKIIKLESDIVNFGQDELFLSDKDFAQMPTKKRALFYLKAPGRIRKIIRKHQITHSIAFGDMANVFSSLTFTKEYKVASIHALKSVEFVNKNYLNKIFKQGFRTSYKYFDKVVCISKAIKEDLINNCRFKFIDKLQVIYNPHDIKLIEEKSRENLEPEEEELFKGRSILFLGRLSMQKSPWHLIKAFYLLQKEIEDIKLIFIGDGDTNVENYCKKLMLHYGLENKIVFLGRRSNPYKYLVKADVLALSSLYEGTPNVIVESIAVGVPVVSSNCTGGILELMTNQDVVENQDVTITESGIVTPNFFEGKIQLPENFDISDKETLFFKALQMVLKETSFKGNLEKNKKELLEKFDLTVVSQNYLV